MIVPLVGSLVASSAVCGPYLYAINRLLQQTTDRNGNDFNYSTEHIFNYEDTLGSLIYPPAAQFEGWYYFGTFGVLLIVVFLLTGARNPYVNREWAGAGSCEIPGSGYSARWTKLCLLGWFGTITYITYGRESVLFVFLWEHAPLFSSLRVWGRFNIVLVPIIAWLLALAYQNMERQISDETLPCLERSKILGVVALGGTGILCLQAFLLWHQIVDPYWSAHAVGSMLPLLLRTSGLAEAGIAVADVANALDASFLMSAIASVATLLFLFALSQRRAFKSRRALRQVLGGLIVVAMLSLGIVGPLIWTFGVAPVEERHRLNVGELDEVGFSTRRTEGGTISLRPDFFVDTVPNWYLQRYVTFRGAGVAEPEAMQRLLGMVDGRRLYCTREIRSASIQGFLDDADGSSGCELQKVAYTGDTLLLAVNADANRYISFIDNWYEGWQASVDGQQVPIELLFGTFKSVKVSAGRHRVSFAYEPRLYGP